MWHPVTAEGEERDGKGTLTLNCLSQEVTHISSAPIHWSELSHGPQPAAREAEMVRKQVDIC